MGQLRDWWPSEDTLAKRSSAILPSPTQTPLQLSEAAAALNEDNKLSPHVPNNQPISSFAFLPSSPLPQPCPRPPIKLINSHDHKQELLRNLLNPRPADLPQPVHAPSPSLHTQHDDMLNPRSPGSFGLLLQQAHSKPSSSSPLCDDVSLSLFKKYTPSTPTEIMTHEVQHHTIDESLTSERTSGGPSHEVHHHKQSSTSEKLLQHDLINKESLPSEKTHIIHNVPQNTMNKGLETLHDPTNKQSLASEKTRILHGVQHHSINKESLSRREIHIFSERERRKGMTHLYTTLLSLLPDAKPKTDRCKVLTDAIDYIHVLREQVDSLGSQKSEILASLGELGENPTIDYTSSAEGEATNSSTITGISEEAKEEILSAADVAVRFCGKEAFITLNSSKSKGVWSGILQILHEHDMEILNVALSSGNEMDHHCIHAKISTKANIRSQQVQKILQDFVLNRALLD